MLMMLTILELLAVLLVPLPSLTEGEKVKGFCFEIYEDLNLSDLQTEKVLSESVNQILMNLILCQSDFKSKYY